MGDDDSWLQVDVSWLSSRAAITGEELLRFPTHLIDGRVPRLESQVDSSVGALDYTLRDNLVCCPVPSVRFGDLVDYCYDVVGDHPDVVRRTRWILRTQSTQLTIHLCHVVHVLVGPY